MTFFKITIVFFKLDTCFKKLLPLYLKECYPFAFSGEEKFPDVKFTPISSENSRATRQRLTTNRLINRFHRKKSAYMRNENDVERLVSLATQVIAMLLISLNCCIGAE